MNHKSLRKKYNQKKLATKKRNLEWSLSFQEWKDLENSTTCFYTGIPLVPAIGVVQNPDTLTIDRVNSHIGYVPGNCVACCYAVNLFKAKHFEVNRSIITHPFYQPILDGIKRFEDSQKIEKSKISKLQRIWQIITE